MFAKRLSKAGNVEMAMALALGWSTKMGMEMEMERSWELQMELKLNLNLRLEDRQRRHRSHHHTRTWHQITDSGVHSSASVTQSRVPPSILGCVFSISRSSSLCLSAAVKTIRDGS